MTDASTKLRTLLGGGALALSLFVLAAAPLAAQEAPDESDADMPPFATGIDKEAYMRARAEYISLLRGVPTFQSYDARALAIQQMDAVERLRRPDVEIGAWTPLGPNPIPNGQVVTGPQLAVSGRVSAIAVDPTDEDIVYVGAAQGGVYRSLNGGTSWTQIFDGADSLAIGALAIAPSSPTTLYVGTGESALSADSFFGVGVYRIDNATTTADLVGPFNPLVTTGIANTTAFTGRAISEILVHPTLPGTIFVATTSGTSSNPSGSSVGFTVPPLAIRGLYRSTDADTANPSFTKLTVTTAGSIAPDASGDRSITDIAMDPTDPNTMVAWVLGNAAAGDGGVYRSTNALTTATFTQTYTTTTSSSRGELAGNRVGATITFFAASGDASSGQLRRSTDGGATWSAALTAANGFCGGQCFYDIAVAVHPTNANILNVGGAPTFAAGRSTDGGATFTSNATSASGVHGDTHVIAIATALPAVVYLGTDGGIYRSSDSGITWSTLNNSDFYATQFQSLAQHPTDPDFLIGGTQDNGTEFRMPGGAWTRADFGDGGYALIDQNAADTTNVTMYHTYFNQTNAMGFARVTNVASATEGNWTGFGCGFGGFIANGITCTASNILFYAPMALGPGSPNTVYFGSDQLYRSANLGVTMPAVSQVLQSGQPITTIAIAPTNDNVRIVGLRNGQVFATTTGGNPIPNVTAAAMPDPDPNDTGLRRAVTRAAIDPKSANTAWVAFGGYGVASGEHIWKTTNLAAGAAGWTAAGAGIPDVPVNALAIDPNATAVVYAGTDIGVFATYDGGLNWTPYGSGLPRVAVFDMGVFDGGAALPMLRIATHGRGIWEIGAAGIFSDAFETGNFNGWDGHP